ncbi:MAG: hypothetical protein IJO56_00280 [Oscillospiraceae bacterium]|nr:hypothetical protein [Oscillospiraceae bacterium]
MKASAMKRYNYYATRNNTPSRYPNAAKREGVLRQLPDILLAVAITVGAVAILLFLLALG